jgi:peptidyl-prolyl cis-trans isomerase D
VEATQEAAANAALASIRSGEDFAELARARSEDPGSAPAGGDLGWFERGRMVKEFEDAAFALSPGAMSGVVRTPFGFHIIKTTSSRPPGTRPFEEVREEIRRGLAVQRAQEEVRTAADAFTTRLASQESSFDSTAGELGLTVERTGSVARGEPAGRLGRLPLAEDAIFSLSPGGNSAAVSVPQGLAVFHLVSIGEPQPEPFESVRERVGQDWKTARAREQARSAAERITRASGDLRSRISGMKLSVASLAAVTRSQPMPPLTDAAKEAAFIAPPGSVLGPFDAPDGLVLLEVTRMQPSTPAEAEAERASLREKLLEEEQDEMYRAMMTRLERRSEVEINYALTRVGAVSR